MEYRLPKRKPKMSSSEKKIGLIPKVVVASRMGPSEYALLITDKRSIFILEKSSKAGLAGAVGGVVGAAIAQAATTRKAFDYANESIDNFAINQNNIVVPHESLNRYFLCTTIETGGPSVDHSTTPIPPCYTVKTTKSHTLPTLKRSTMNWKSPASSEKVVQTFEKKKQKHTSPDTQ